MKTNHMSAVPHTHTIFPQPLKTNVRSAVSIKDILE